MQMSNHHHTLVKGMGRCSVPMWSGGCPAGFCDAKAYGERPPGATWRDAWSEEIRRYDGKYSGYIPGLACPAHGGPSVGLSYKPAYTTICRYSAHMTEPRSMVNPDEPGSLDMALYTAAASMLALRGQIPEHAGLATSTR